MDAILTGSRVYGIIHAKSDIDLAILADKETVVKLMDLSDETPGSIIPNSGQVSLRFGNLNLIVCWEEKAMQVWAEGTERLNQIKPVTKDVACALFNQLREEAGLVA